jgi:hypothetical protein
MGYGDRCLAETGLFREIIARRPKAIPGGPFAK